MNWLSDFTRCFNFILTLAKASYAQKYAEENDIDFVPVHPFLAN